MKRHSLSPSFRGLIALLAATAWWSLAGASGAFAQGTAALVNAASYETTTVGGVQTGIVAPGSIASLFAANMTAQPAQWAQTSPLPTTLAGITVKVGGIAAPIFYASPTQVNLQVPSGVAAGTATVEVFNGSSTPLAAGNVMVLNSAPGIFSFDSSGKNQAAVQNAVDYSPNADFDRYPGARPEAAGQYLTIYATGLGATAPAVADGQPAPFSPLALGTSDPIVTIGGQPAQVVFSGLAPGLVGLWQINVLLPDTLPTNLATSLSVTLRGRDSGQNVTVAVAAKSEFGSVSGKVVSALTGAPLAGVNLSLAGVGRSASATTDAQGKYNFYVLKPGSYTLGAAANGLISASQNTTVAGGLTNNVLVALTSPLANSNQYRVVLAWQSAVDLDAHLTGPLSDLSRFHVWWNGEKDFANATPTATFDRDDATGAGPETLTFSALGTGNYRFSVQNYTDRDYPGGRTLLANTGAVVTIYRGSQQVAVITAPGGGGTLWKVFEITNGQFSIVNQLGDEPDPSNVKASF